MVPSEAVKKGSKLLILGRDGRVDRLPLKTIALLGPASPTMRSAVVFGEGRMSFTAPRLLAPAVRQHQGQLRQRRQVGPNILFSSS